MAPTTRRSKRTVPDDVEVISIDSDDSDKIEGGNNAFQPSSSTSLGPRLREPSGLDFTRTSAGDVLGLTLELSPLEQSAPRRYIRIAMMLPWTQHESFLGMQLREVHKFVGEAFYKTLQNWPFLGGCFCPSNRDPTKLQLRYPETLDQRELARLVRIQEPAEKDAIFRGNFYRLPMKNFGKERFVWENDPGHGDWFPPVTVKISFVDSAIVLGFAFSEVIFDGEFLQNFFTQFTRNTHDVDGKSFRDVELFPFYDWSSGLLERQTPRRRLRCQVLTIESRTIQDLYGMVQEVISTEKTGGVALYEDCVLALFWVAIMRARFQNGTFGPRDLGRVNYYTPGARHTRNPRRVDPQYCGNSTITPVAACSAAELIRATDDPHDGLPRIMRPEDLALAAQLLRAALQEFTAHHLRHLTALKEMRDVTEERIAYERALRRHTDRLAFEDWTYYGTNHAPHIPYVEDDQSFFFPCYDHMQEGTVILLPRKGQYWGNEDWNVCVCLDEDDLDLLLHNLDWEGWWKPIN
ncbi:trichothecene 3-o-acetyltransferase [Ilyonectria robusta]